MKYTNILLTSYEYSQLFAQKAANGYAHPPQPYAQGNAVAMLFQQRLLGGTEGHDARPYLVYFIRSSW